MTSPSQEELLCVCGHYKSNHMPVQSDCLECVLECECVDFTLAKPVPNEPSDRLKLCPGCRKVRIYKEVDVCSACSNKGRKGEPSAIGDELDSLYRPEITDLEKNEYQGNDRPVIYLADAKRVLEQQTKLALEVAKKDVEFAIRWNRPLEEVLEKMNQRLEASIKERSEG